MNVMHPSLSGPFFVEREQERLEGSSSSRVDRSFVKHLGLNWSRCFYYAAALLLLALNQTRSRNIRLMKLFQFV